MAGTGGRITGGCSGVPLASQGPRSRQTLPLPSAPVEAAVPGSLLRVHQRASYRRPFHWALWPCRYSVPGCQVASQVAPAPLAALTSSSCTRVVVCLPLLTVTLKR